jgi:hypothetical protein
MNQDREAAAQGLPPDYELQGEGVATLALIVADCPAAVVGNATVVEPFRYAVLYHLLRPLSDQANQVDGFVREFVANTPLAVDWLASAGLPAVVGEVALSAPGEAYGVTVSAPGIDYRASGAPPTQGPSQDASAFAFCYRVANDTRAVWLQDEVSRTSRSNLPAVVTVRAEAGYLATASPAGLAAARIEESSGAAVLALHEEIYG